MKAPYINSPIQVAVDCIIFGFDGKEFKLLLIQEDLSHQKEKWRLAGDLLLPFENIDHACKRILKNITGMSKVFKEQLQTLNDPYRHPEDQTIATAYIVLIDIQKSKRYLCRKNMAKWFSINELPTLICNHRQMVKMGMNWLRYKSTLHPILFELLPEKFTLPQIYSLYKFLFKVEFDQRNFNKKFLSTGLLIRQDEKEKENSKKGAFYFKLHQKKYKSCLDKPTFIINPSKYIEI